MGCRAKAGGAAAPWARRRRAGYRTDTHMSTFQQRETANHVKADYSKARILKLVTDVAKPVRARHLSVQKQNSTRR